MNKLNLQKFRNDVMRFVDSNGRKRDCVNLNTHNSLLHELIKFRMCFELQKRGIQYISEAKFTNQRGITDILILDFAQAVEIMVSETKEQLEYKVKKYPSELEVIAVKDWESFFNNDYQAIKR